MNIDNLESEKGRALSELYKKYECAHEHSEIRRRVVAGGAVQHVYQCQQCGKATSNPMRKEKAVELSKGGILVSFDEDLVRNWENGKSRDVAKVIGDFESKKEFMRAEFFERYSQYLKSEEWQKKRKLVLARAQGKCEGCGEAQAMQVHHLTYEHMGDEFLFELVALCDECHDRIHADE